MRDLGEVEAAERGAGGHDEGEPQGRVTDRGAEPGGVVVVDRDDAQHEERERADDRRTGQKSAEKLHGFGCHAPSMQ